jgi:hypothetical protein
MHEDHDVSRQNRQKDTLSAEDLGILLQWHWKYGTATFTNERQRVQLSLLMLFSAFTGSRPDTLLGDDSLSKMSDGEDAELLVYLVDGEKDIYIGVHRRCLPPQTCRPSPFSYLDIRHRHSISRRG